MRTPIVVSVMITILVPRTHSQMELAHSFQTLHLVMMDSSAMDRMPVRKRGAQLTKEIHVQEMMVSIATERKSAEKVHRMDECISDRMEANVFVSMCLALDLELLVHSVMRTPIVVSVMITILVPRTHSQVELAHSFQTLHPVMMDSSAMDRM